jgi:hypothetical protein
MVTMVHLREENLAKTQKGYDAFAAADLDAFRELIASDAVWRTVGQDVFEAEYKGIDAILGYFTRLFELSGGTFKVDVTHMLADDDRSIVMQRVTATREDKTLDTHMVIVFEIRDGMVREITEYTADPAALMAFWS